MYKRILHSIQEEHFDHPYAIDVQLGAGNTRPKSTTTGGHPGAYLLPESVMTFRMNSRTLWSKFIWGLLNYSVALNNGVSGLDQVEKRTYKYAKDIGEYVMPYYGISNSEKLGTLLSDFTKVGIEVVNDLKAGKAMDGTKERWDGSIVALVDFLHQLNPDSWSIAMLKDYFDHIVKFWIASIKARDEKNWTANDEAINNLEKLVIVGMDTVGGDFNSLADMFSKGLITQFPHQFV